jgi:hypothetical protein
MAEWTKPGMVHVVRIAMQLANEGSIPKLGEHGRTSDFLKRCAATLQAIDPNEETTLTKLSADDQQLIRQALGGVTAAWEGCFGCLEDDPGWVLTSLSVNEEAPMQMSLCAKCKCPKSMGRKWTRIADTYAGVTPLPACWKLLP